MDTNNEAQVTVSPIPNGAPEECQANSQSLLLEDVIEREKLIKETRFIWFKLLFHILPRMAFFVVNYFSNVYSIINYYREGNYWFFGFSLFDVLFANFYTTVLSDSMYADEGRCYTTLSQRSNSKFLLFCRWTCISFFLRDVDTFWFILKVIQAKKRSDYAETADYYFLMNKENNEATFIILLKCFLISAPQLVLDLYITITSGFILGSVISNIRVVSMVLSVIGMAIALTFTNRMTCLSRGVLFLANLFGIIARITALSVFAVVFGDYFWVGCLIHWLVMFISSWIQTEVEGVTCIQKFYFCAISGIIHLFAFVEFHPGETSNCFPWFYYGIYYLENLIAMLFWWQIESARLYWFYDLFLYGQMGSFVLNITLLAVYYGTCLHSNLLVLTKDYNGNNTRRSSDSPSQSQSVHFFMFIPKGSKCYLLKKAPDAEIPPNIC